MQNLPFKDINSFPKLFCDYIERKKSVLQYFNTSDNVEKSFDIISKSNRNKNLISSAIKESMGSVKLSQMQLENLNTISQNSTLTIVTGQQPGFLGGPLYVFYKAVRAIAKALQLKKQYDQFNFIPVFWVEDNDHDRREVSAINIYDSDYNIHTLNCGPKFNDNSIIASQTFGDDIIETINKTGRLLPETSNKHYIITRLKEIYKPGKSWTQAFIELMNESLGKYGMLFLSASVVREHGLFDEIARKELMAIGKSGEIIADTNRKITDAGYNLQAKAFEINLFLHEGNYRHKLKPTKNDNYLAGDKYYTIDELRDFASKEKGRFSPQVLLRPIVQDLILPTAVYVAGPSEIGYLAQTKELYEYFDVQMPQIVPRLSTTLLDKKTAKFLESHHKDLAFFFRKFHLIQQELNEKIKDDEINRMFKAVQDNITQVLDSIEDKLTTIDKNLNRSFKATQVKLSRLITKLDNKAQAAQRRNAINDFGAYQQVSNFLYPNGSLQERSFSAINFMNICGVNKFVSHVMEMAGEIADKHYVERL